MHRVLVVEDHADSRRTLAKLLTAIGFGVVEADGFSAATLQAQTQPFDLLISDIGLRDGDGCELLLSLSLRALPGGSRLLGIAVTGYGMPEDIKRCLTAGYTAHVLKPFRFDRLKETIEKVLVDAILAPSASVPAMAQQGFDAGEAGSLHDIVVRS